VTATHVSTGNETHFGYINGLEYMTAAACGRCVQFIRNSPNGIRGVTITIVGSCPLGSCVGQGSFAISIQAMAVLSTGTDVTGSIPDPLFPSDTLTWRYIECPILESMHANLPVLAGQQNASGVQIIANRYGITGVEMFLLNPPVTLVRSADNFWRRPGQPDLGPLPYSFRITDVNGHSVNAMVLAGADVTTSVQFPTCPNP